MNRIKIISNKSKKTRLLKKNLYRLINKYDFIIDNKRPELIIAIGGDGTFLKSLKETYYNQNLYYIGINTGTLGFLQDITINDLEECLRKIKENTYNVEEVSLIDISIVYGGRKFSYNALNEVVIREHELKVLRTKIFINDVELEDFVGDGVLISTPIGSTAHNLSVGGCIVHPSINVLQMQPLAPFPLLRKQPIFNSGIIISDKMKISIVPQARCSNKLLFTIDGDLFSFKEPISKIDIKLSKNKVKILRVSEVDFFARLKSKYSEE